MAMRQHIDSIAFLNGFRGIFFHGSPDDLVIDQENGTLFTDQYAAGRQGRNVYECRIILERPLRVREMDGIPHDLVSMLHAEGYDGYILETDKGRQIVVIDPDAVEVLQAHEMACDEVLDEDGEDILREFRPEAGQHIVMVTGKLAQTGLRRVLEALGPDDFTYEIRAFDIAVAAWISTDLIRDTIGDLDEADLLLIPGKVTGDEQELARALSRTVLRGPNCYSELPTFFERQGIEQVEPDGIVKPKIIMLGSAAVPYGGELAKTYEIPHLTIAALLSQDDPVAEMARDAQAKGEEIKHNWLAEIVRARLMEPDCRNGFMLDGYPRILRDTQWLVDMNVHADAIILMGRPEDAEVADFYRDQPGFMEIDMSDPANVRSDLYTRVEAMLQQCVKPSERPIAK